ncbi:CAP-Gly domain-containing linker protein 1-like isoform X2 [Limulus polyphemus]|uniref:CAP-Gly domain-containing linker protein 1-like isoform X2 n=1 Tax=Limulus polyphemus TaxID=6850 RepID=A0ABM1T2H3_LIMPO|nr:CAP-Gly domain-containing linker protein 1-like isoform X2 [Limulus polyphemus]
MNQKTSGSKVPSKIAKPTSRPAVAPPHNSQSLTAAANEIRTADTADALPEKTENFIIGDKVWVNGTKSGFIQFLGETQFAPGQWAGVVLEEPLGKNDGSVGGIRYFQCEPNKGVFARPHRLSRSPASTANTVSNGTLQTNTDRASMLSSQVGGRIAISTSQLPTSPTPGSVKDGMTPRGVSGSLSTNDSSLKCGDRVVVNATSGVKTGILRYLGTTEFAPGEWAGVDLDEPQGKNDGSVAGKRYFECQMKHGLFAPIHKVSKAGKGSTTTRVTRLSSGTGLTLHRRAGSHESLNSSISSASSAARGGRVRLGVTSLTSPQRSSRPSAANVTATNNAIQEALKEKEEHIEQLLRERDLERAEVARAAGQVDEVEKKLADLQKKHQGYLEETEGSLVQLRKLIEKTEMDKKKLLGQLEDERRKVEDLQFRIEEESINKVDLENQSEKERGKIQELEKLLEEERQRSRSSDSSSNQESPETEMVNHYKEEIEKLNQNLTKSEDRVKSLETKMEYENAVSRELREDVLKKDETILQLEASLESRKREISNLQKRILEMGEDIEQGKQRQDKQLQVIDDLNMKLTRAEAGSNHLSDELNAMKTRLADAEQKLRVSEGRGQELSRQKAKLEGQVSDLMLSSGDNSDQLSQINEEIREKEKQVEELQSQLRSRTQEVEKLMDTVNSLHDQNKQEFEKINDKHKEVVKELKAKLQHQQKELQETQDKVSILSKALSRQEQLMTEKEAVIQDLRHKLEKSESQLTHSQAKLQELQLTLEGLRAEASDTTKNLEVKVQQLQKEIKQVMCEKEKMYNQYQEAKEARAKLEKTQEQLIKEKQEQQATVSDRDAQVVQLKAEVDRLQKEFAKHREELQQKLAVTEQESQVMQDLHNQFNMQRDALSELQNKLVHVEVERDELYQQVLILRGTQEEKDQLENRSKSLQQQLEDLKQSERESLQKMLESAQSQMDQREKDIAKKDQELATMKGDETTLQNYKAVLQNVEHEKKQLGVKIVELQVALARSQANANVEDPEYNRITEEKEALEVQIEFLNSVIVDMQRKNDELKSRIEILESGESFDSGDLNLNGVKTVLAPRLFCDICEMFDLHDTEDCPQQAAEEEEFQHTHHHGKRLQERPYCDSCGVFGHWSAECDDNETF